MKKNIINNEEGMTLVELIVSMGIFTVIMSLTVSFFIVLQREQMTYKDTANLQQEGRMTSEIFSRYAKEAYQVVVKDNNTDGSICSDADASASNIVAGSSALKDYIAFKMGPSSSSPILVFRCDQSDSTNPRYMTMGNLSQTDITSIDITSNDYKWLPFISSGSVTIKDFKPVSNNPPTYPKTLRYNMEVNKFIRDGSASTGDKIYFPGYLILRNEL
ncbi:MAG: prepilin-type N-terminal cleavage/methylation domain-containing protein [Patescibacteria group bacterium]